MTHIEQQLPCPTRCNLQSCTSKAVFRFCPLTPRPGHLQLWRSAQDRSRLSWWSLLCLTLVWFGSVQFGFHILARLLQGRRDPSSLIRIAKVEPGVQPHPSFGYLRGVLETFRPAQRWRRAQAEPMENGVAPGCLGNSQWAAGIVTSAGWRRQVGQALVEVAERQVAGANPAERRSGPLEPRVGA